MTSRFYSFPRKCEEKKDNNVIWIGSCCRLDLNDPPTAVGGIWTFRTASFADWVSVSTWHKNPASEDPSGGSRYLSSHLCNLRKSVDESMVQDSDTTHPQITQITQMS